jgi:D-hydroxyproline dehydrogenase subunit gamma
MFRRLPDAEALAAAVPVVIDGEPFVARAGDSVAAALIAAGRPAFRTTPVSGVPRGPYCLMGVCFDCLVTVDDRPDQRGCLIAVAPGMRIDTQRGTGA